CTGVLLFDGMCETAAQSFQVAEDLRSVTLSAQVPVDDAVTRLTYSFQVNLTFQAIGAAEFLHSKEMFVDRELGIIVTQLVGFIAPATATGTVFGLGQNFTPEPSDTATIQKENN